MEENTTKNILNNEIEMRELTKIIPTTQCQTSILINNVVILKIYD